MTVYSCSNVTTSLWMFHKIKQNCKLTKKKAGMTFFNKMKNCNSFTTDYHDT